MSVRIRPSRLARNRERRITTLLMVLFALIGLPSLCLGEISPSQVLVLYNADWTEDHFLTDPGQDSKEIAEYYVCIHTDPQTGKMDECQGTWHLKLMSPFCDEIKAEIEVKL